MDNILRQLEGLSRHELVWLNTYLAGRLRALPPSSVQQSSAQPEVTTTTSPTASGCTNNPGPTAATLAPLPERIEALNYSLDPWERTGAAPQGWANHLQQSLLPIQGYIQLRPQASSPLPAFGTTCPTPPDGTGDTETAAQTAPRRLGKASKPVSIFARAPLCKDTCRYTARPGHAMSVLNMMTTPAMIVNKDFYIPTECLVPHGGLRSFRAVSSGVANALPNDAVCVIHTIFTFVCDVSANLRLIPPA